MNNHVAEPFRTILNNFCEGKMTTDEQIRKIATSNAQGCYDHTYPDESEPLKATGRVVTYFECPGCGNMLEFTGDKTDQQVVCKFCEADIYVEDE